MLIFSASYFSIKSVSLVIFEQQRYMLLRLPIYQEKTSKSETLVDVLRNGISNYVKELQGAKAVIDGNLVRIALINLLNVRASYSLVFIIMEQYPLLLE